MRADPAPTGRLAPSPTGRLHLGHARSFLLAWWSARSRGGRVVLRMEDLDPDRSRPEHVDGVLRDLEWLGLDWDGPVLMQSARGEAYREALAGLEARGLAYPCVCTRREIEAAGQAPHRGEEAVDGTQRYPGTCRGRFRNIAEARTATGREPALRFLVREGPVRAEDELHGALEGDVQAQVGDFPVVRRDGVPAYQLAVVVDDAHQGVTEVVRGDDLLPSTLRQALLLEALGLPRPVWRHVSLVTDAQGRRLAKRSDDLALAHLREAGIAPGRIAAWAARSAGMENVPEEAHARELALDFEWARVERADVATEPGDWRP